MVLSIDSYASTLFRRKKEVHNFVTFQISAFFGEAATSIPVYVTGWCGHGVESHSQPFLLTYPEADLTYYF